MNLGQYRRYLGILNITDMDVVIALYSHDFATDKDVASIARRLPIRIRRIVINFIKDLSEEIKARK